MMDSITDQSRGMCLESSSLSASQPSPRDQRLSLSLGESSDTDNSGNNNGNNADSADNNVPALSVSAARGDQMKERPTDNSAENNGVGAVQVDEQAPSLNRLFFRGRRSFLVRQRAGRAARKRDRNNDNIEATQQRHGSASIGGRTMEEVEMPNAPQSGTRSAVEEQDAPNATVVNDKETRTTFRRASEFVNVRVRTSHLLQATLVEDVGVGEVVEAEPMGLIERKWKMFASVACAFVLALLAISVTVLSARQNGNQGQLLVMARPTTSPTFDPRSTLEIIKGRGHVRCGMTNRVIESETGLYWDLCRSVAAVVLGNPDSILGVPTTYATRWQHLLDRTVDLVVLGDTYTIEREIGESTTGSGFTFSTPYNYDGMVYAGNRTFVKCAEEHKRYEECFSLQICVESDTTYHALLKTLFPPAYITVVSTLDETTDMLFNRTCNVIISEKTFIQIVTRLNDAIRDGRFVMGNRTWSKEPYAIITRNTDREFSDVVNWVVHAVISGTEQGLSKNASLCQNRTYLALHDASKLDFMNAVHCVGNYAQIIGGDVNNGGMNTINYGTGMLYAIPFGNTESASDAIVEPATGSMMMKIRNQGYLTCGVVVPNDFEGDIAGSDKLIGMSADYCRALSAAIFTGNPNKVNFLKFTEANNSSAVALSNRTLDVLVGGRNLRRFDFETPPLLEGLRFSTPYYYGNESAIDGDVSFYSMITRDSDVLFASFVNCVVLATIQAQENHAQKTYREMPLVSVFGSNFSWALRDVIAYSGRYDEIYEKHFGSEVAGISQGRNTLNEGGPLLLSFLRFPRH